MYNVARLSDKDRDTIFTRYAFEYGNNKAIIEKDFCATGCTEEATRSSNTLGTTWMPCAV